MLQHAVRAEGRSERLIAFSADVVVGEAQARERRVLVEGRRERPMDQARERCVRMPPGAAARAGLGRSRALLRRRRGARHASCNIGYVMRRGLAMFNLEWDMARSRRRLA